MNKRLFIIGMLVLFTLLVVGCNRGQTGQSPTATPTLRPTWTPTPRPTSTPTAVPTATNTPRPEDRNDLESRVSALESMMERMLEILERMQTSVPPTQPAPRTEGTQNTPQSGSGWTASDKCAWLNSNVPQGNDGLDLQHFAASLLSVPNERIRVHLYPCGDSTMVYDGFIVLGPREGPWNGLVTAVVPLGGAVDSYNEASYSAQPTRIGQNTLRATQGTVTATTMTVWFWLDENPPTSGVSMALPTAVPTAQATQATRPQATAVPPTPVPPTATPISCEQPADLASRMGWTNAGWADQRYGGLRVELTSQSQLPPMWEAITGGITIRETDANRAMAAGTWTIYPPFSCREQLGFSK